MATGPTPSTPLPSAPPKKLTIPQTSALAPLKTAVVEEKKIAESKALVTQAAEIKYTLSASETTELKRKQKALITQSQATADFKNIVAIEELVLSEEIKQEDLTELGIYLPVKSTTIEDIRAILEKREIVAATKIVNFDLEYNIEAIPKPDANKMYSISTVEKNIFDVPVWSLNVDTNKYEQKHVLKNFIRQTGGNYKLSVGGVAGTHFEVIIKNETNNTYYNWNTVSEVRVDAKTQVEHINTVAGSFQNGVSYYQGVIPIAGREIISIYIPTVSSETVYRLGFVSPRERGLSTDYGNLPMFEEETKPMYTITQLMRSSTTIKFEDSERLGIGTGDLVINHAPGSKLNSSNATRGEYDIELTINHTGKREIALNTNGLNGVVNRSAFELDDYDTEILDINLVASIVENSGIVKGTVTLGKSSLRPSTLSLRADDIFTLNQSIT